MTLSLTPAVQPQPVDGKPVNIIIDECFHSRMGMISLYEQAGTPFEIIGFSSVMEFISWRECHHNRICSLIIYIHDRLVSVPDQMAQFLVTGIEKNNISKRNVIVVCDVLNNFMHLCTNKLNIYNLLDGLDSLYLLRLQLKEYVDTGCINPLFVKRCFLQKKNRYAKTTGDLSPAEIFAISNVLTGRGVKETSKFYKGHFKTLYNQRMSAIKKLGMHSVQDVIKYRHLIDALYLEDNTVVNADYLEVLC